MKDIRCKSKIPSRDFILSDVEYDLSDEKLVKLTSSKVIFSPMHLFNGVSGAKNECLLRESVVKKIKQAADTLPEGYYLKIYDAWRPLELQKELYNRYKDGDCIDRDMISKPIKDLFNGPIHTTGGAVDITIVNKQGIELNMGTKFGEYSEKSQTDYFELRFPDNIEVIKNRRLLYNVMTDVGFTNIPTKWWHYDFGNRYWAYYTKEPAKYGCEFV